jgi:hypothetical protein
METFPDPLESWPRATPRHRQGEAHRGEPLGGGEVYYLHVDLPVPELSRHLRERRDHALGQVPIPLGPHRVLAVGEIEGVDDISSLPAVVGRRLAFG